MVAAADFPRESNVGPCVKAASVGGEVTEVGLEVISSLTLMRGFEWMGERAVA